MVWSGWTSLRRWHLSWDLKASHATIWGEHFQAERISSAEALGQEQVCPVWRTEWRPGWLDQNGGEDRFEMKLGKWTGYGKEFILYLICKGKLFDWCDIIWVLKSLSDGCVESKLYGGGGLSPSRRSGLNDKHWYLTVLEAGKSTVKALAYLVSAKPGFANKGSYSQSYGFSSSHVWIWELDHKEG